jgi:DNA polymerase-4
MRAILHVDMDAFYASVEQNDRPELRGQPIIVGGESARGVVAAASYEVRKFGVRSAMPTQIALQRCPHAIVVKPRMARYREVSERIFSIFKDYTPLIEGLSLDEAFLDVTASLGLFGSAIEIAETIKRRIRTEIGLTGSVGVSHNKLLAKIASDLKKPDGLCEIPFTDVLRTLDQLPIRRLAGIGTKTAARLEENGISTFAQLRTATDSVLVPLFGRYTPRVRERAAGIDERAVVSDSLEKQVSAEETFATDLTRHEALTAELGKLADRVGTRLRGKQLMCSTVTVKIRKGDFSTHTRSRSFNPPTAETATLLRVARELLNIWLTEQSRAAIRLLGISVSTLSPATQLDLFGIKDSKDTLFHKNSPQNLDPTLDLIRQKFGSSAVQRASSLSRVTKHDISSEDDP